MNRSLSSETGGKYNLGQRLPCAKTQSRNTGTRAKEPGRSQDKSSIKIGSGLRRVNPKSSLHKEKTYFFICLYMG